MRCGSNSGCRVIDGTVIAIGGLSLLSLVSTGAAAYYANRMEYWRGRVVEVIEDAAEYRESIAASLFETMLEAVLEDRKRNGRGSPGVAPVGEGHPIEQRCGVEESAESTTREEA